MKKNSIKVKIFDIDIDNILYPDFLTILQEVATNLDDADNSERRILDKHYNKETSIWFDSFDRKKICNNSDYTCFLLAKDVNYILTEDSTKKEIKHLKSENIRPKTPAHCIFVKSKNLLLIEQITNSPTEATLKRGLSKTLDFKENDLIFKAVQRTNVIERLNKFIETISHIELDLSPELFKYVGNIEDDGFLTQIITDPNTKTILSLGLKSNNFRENTFKFFENAYRNGNIRELLNNMKITYLNEFEEEEITKLAENLVYLTLEKELEHQEILDTEDRLEYSKNIYSTMIQSYEEYYSKN